MKAQAGGKKKRNRRQVLEAIEPALVPLLELFADVDEVFAEEGAFDSGNIHKSLGRIYRQWLNTRTALDPDFDPERYRLDQKQRNQERKTVRVGLSVLPASDSPKRSMDPTSISEKSQRPSAKHGKRSAKRSASSAPSAGTASSGRSKKKSRTGYGEA